MAIHRQKRIDATESTNGIGLTADQIGEDFLTLGEIPLALQQVRQPKSGFVLGGDRDKSPLDLDSPLKVLSGLAEFGDLLQELRVTRIRSQQTFQLPTSGAVISG